MTRAKRNAYAVVTGVYTLALGVWVGALVMLAVGAAVTFRTTRAYNPSLPAPYDSPELAGRASQILAGGIVGNMIDALSRVQIICGVVAAVCVLVQMCVFRTALAGRGKSWMNLVRVICIAVPLVNVAFERFYLNPAIHELRAAMYDTSVSDQFRASAKLEFDRLHQLSERTTGGAALLLMIAMLVSPLALTARPDEASVGGVVARPA